MIEPGAWDSEFFVTLTRVVCDGCGRVQIDLNACDHHAACCQWCGCFSGRYA